MSSRASRFACALILALGCAEEGAEPAASAAESSSLEPAAETPGAPTAEAPQAAAEPAEPQTIEAPVPEGAGAGLGEAGAALGEAIRAGAAAEGATPCETAYASAIAMIEALQERTGQAGQGTPPDRAAYLEGCNELPAEAQQCLVIGYALEHAQECQSWRTDPRVLALRDRLAR